MDPNPYPHSVRKTSAGGGGGVPSPHSYALSGKIMLSAIVILFSIILLILFLHFYVRWHVIRRATSRARRRRRRFIFAGENQSPASNRAIDPAILKSLPILLFSPSAGDDGELDECDCAVCLNEFEDGQKIRKLPVCGHSFHIDCIDMWFSSHSNCPLCRAVVEAVPSVSDLCSLCLQREGIGSSSSDSGEGEVAIEVPQGGIERLSGDAEGLGLGQALKWPINRIVLLRRFLCVSGTMPDIERGEGAAPPPSPAV
ncbi:RING-H2 finger protein ATL2-like [Phalaenopsis equestris]|uniref:RING-H2 finger protein ATL2-like n=1 Tax=Phalaenopsis equestris TaxID=78828 RepID=UPI0009E54535|nr:RING-H2 finger protein ATL2-like [Phalaenopsis equestris]